jgi:HAD superfamily hydrolase (TIGR01490 family)
VAANLAQQRLPERSVVAVFDLDGTVTRGDTLLPFLRWLVGPWAFALRLVALAPVLLGMALGLVGRDRAKEIVLRAFVAGMRREELAEHGKAFAAGKLPMLLRREALDRLRWHQERGHRCILASASLDVYVEPWARAAGFHDVVSSALEYDAAGRSTGRFDGANCRGVEKLRRIEALYGDLPSLVAHGYGDSADDRPFLARCAEAHYRPFRHGAGAGRQAALLVQLMRPHQWVKNGFVFVGVLFGHAWTVPQLMLDSVLAALAFCFAASAVYVVNDYADRERDRVHPQKRHRPLASGRVAPRAALALALVLIAASAALALAASGTVLAIVAGYAAMNLAYSFALKNIVILDVFVIAAGFILRILAGTLGIGIEPSQWLLVCSLFLTLFLGFTKRRSELLAVGADFLTHRKALLNYNPQLLDKVIGVCAAAALMSYSLYTMSPLTAQTHGTENLIYTIPFVAYGVFRYLYLLHAAHAGADASREIAKDRHLVVVLLGWAAVTLWLIT